MYLGDKIALDDLKNRSICIMLDDGIRNIIDGYDLFIENTVYVENISQDGEILKTISKGNMVRYKPVLVVCR